MITNRCPLNCAHCGPESGPAEWGDLDPDTMVRMIHEAAAHGCIGVNLSGGEPFLLGIKLLPVIEAARMAGLICRITTGAYWSRTLESARRHLQPLAEAGLSQLVLSCGDSHQQFVPLVSIVHASRAARELGIQTVVNVAMTRNALIRARQVRAAFEEADEIIPLMRETPVIPFGRGSAFERSDLFLRPLDQIAGPCPSLARNPTVQSNGNVTGCAVVFGRELSALTFGDARSEPASTLLERMDRSPLSVFIRSEGLVALKGLIEAQSEIRFADSYVNICHLCGDILGNTDARRFLSDVGLSSSGDLARGEKDHANLQRDIESPESTRQ
jgi:MoaA/NifB/PqqE/SkfB family radical SAM enzyme